ncbi:hypothetical protein [Lysinibacillus capsici]|uniref:hypothetical protein n=1 Tax=Lysinibacillus capsici TaxID=2115968 RepID=UPI00325FDC0F
MDKKIQKDKFKRKFAASLIGYGIAVFAFIVTVITFIFPDNLNLNDKIYLIVIFFMSLIFAILYDSLAIKKNDLLDKLDSDTKDLIYSYEQLKKYEIENLYKKTFSEFTRFTSIVSAIQVYNYHLLPKKNGGTIKIEYEYGSVQEGIDINSIVQNYYDYNREIIKKLKKSILNLRINNESDLAFELFEKISDDMKGKIKANEDVSELFAIWLILCDEIISSIKNYRVDMKDMIDSYLGEDFKIDGFRKTGLYQSIIYSDILRLKEMHLFSYEGYDISKENRLYVSVKATSSKGDKKIFLIILNGNDIEDSYLSETIDNVISDFQTMLSVNNLVASSYTINKKEGVLHDSISNITKHI